MAVIVTPLSCAQRSTALKTFCSAAEVLFGNALLVICCQRRPMLFPCDGDVTNLASLTLPAPNNAEQSGLRALTFGLAENPDQLQVRGNARSSVESNGSLVTHSTTPFSAWQLRA